MKSKYDDTFREKVRAMWDEGVSATEIGVKMRITKDAVVSLSHQMRLDARPSPIKTLGTPRKVAGAGRRKVPSLDELTREKKW